MSTAVLPKAIQKQLDKATEIEQAMAAQNAPKDQVAVVETPAPVEVAPAPAVPELTPAPAPEPQKQAANGNDRDSDAVYWRKRFDTVQGMLNFEIKQLERAFADKITEMQRQFEQQVQKAPPQAPTSGPLISAKDEEAFGSDLIDLARRAAREEFSRLAAPLFAEVRKELNPVREQVGKVIERQETSEQERFYQTLTAMVPEWEQINADTRWLEWLGEVDMLLGAPRQKALDDAHQAMDVQRVAGLFNTWKAQYAPKPKSAARDLERQVAPPKTGGSSAVPSAPKVWSRADYERAFDPRVTRSMATTDVVKLQAEADRAAQEGRVRWA